MWVPFCAHIVLLFCTQFILVTCQEKGSLTFVIDTTLSMKDDIAQVKRSADKITEAVFQEKASQIQNMLLVTFNDPHAKLEGVIDDRATFKSKIKSVFVHNLYSNWDCPEMSMKGLSLALENSLPGSFIYVFTDASAKDYKKSAEIIKMCQKKQSQIVFVLTGQCYGLRDPAFKVFSEIASACSGIAFYVKKSDVDGVIDTITDTIKGRQAPLTVKKVPAHQYVQIPFEIDEETEYAIITVSGVDVVLRVDGPGGKQERGLWTRNAKVIKLYYPTPGTYHAAVRGKTETSVYVVGRTDFTFTYGFSEHIPNAMSDTGLQPVSYTPLYLSIALNDPKGRVLVESAQILDMDEHVLKTLPLTRMSNGIYLTATFKVPIHPFKVAVFGKSVRTGKFIQRIGKGVVTPTKPVGPIIKSKKPVVEISEGSSSEVEYGKTVKLACKVSAYPKPEIIWTNSNKSITFTSQSEVVDPPYEYISYLTLSQITESDKYSCHAANSASPDGTSQTISIVVQDPFQVNSHDTIEGTKEFQYGGKATLRCDIKSPVPMTISWSYVQESTGVTIPIVASGRYSLSSDGTKLDIIRMDLDMAGSYSCNASLVADPKKNLTFSTTVKINGLKKPKATGVEVQKIMKGSSVVLKCEVSGIPKPKITWEFMANTRSTYALIPGSDEVLRIASVQENDAGRYKCIAINVVGKDEHVTTLNVQISSSIISSPDSTTVHKAVEGKDRVLKIPCKATGHPKPVITWRVNGVTITPSAKYSIEDGTLIIKDLKVSDSRSYSCEAKNEAGTADRTFQAVIFQQPDVNGQSSLIIDKGKSVDIKCNVVKGVPIPTMTWYFMANGRSEYKLIRESSNVLRISSVAENDAGRYKCVAKNDIGTDQHETTLTVRVPSTLLPSSSVEYKAVEDKDHVLKIPCKASGLPKPIITWRVNGVAISTSSKYTIEDGALIIHDPKVSDSQSYKCEAKNDAGVAERVFQVVIRQKPQITGTVAKTIVKGKSVAIECNVVKGVPIPTMTWYFMANGRSEYKLIRESSNVLRISSVAENDAGRYKCVAKNDIGTDQHVTTLIVRAPSTLMPSSSVEYKAVEDEDRVLKIPCKATGLPKPVITWRVNGVAISTSSKYTIEDGALIIHDPKVSDSQSYRCEAKNDAGVAERVFQVVILQKPQITGTVAKTIVKGKSVAIECNVVKGVPIPKMTWYFMANGRSEYKLIRESSNVLRISSVTENDAGRYKCVAKNDIGTDQHETTLTVRAPSTLLPSSSVEYKAVEDEDHVLKIPCKASGLPKPVITWRVNGVAISTSSKYTIEDGALIIHDPKVSDSQSYRCEAKNDAGVAERVFQVVIRQKPQITGTVAKTIVKGKSVAIECNVVKGVPIPTMTWYFMANGRSEYKLIRESSNVLRISSVAENDAGRYKCVAKNDIGTDQHETTLTVRAPSTLLPSSSVEYKAVEDKDHVLKIPCKATGLPKPVITWRVNGVAISTSSKYTIEDGALIIHDPKVSDSQSYRCEAKNDASVAERVFQIVILQKPHITGIAAKTVVKGNSVAIECNVVKGVPIPTMTWYFMANGRSDYKLVRESSNVLRLSSVAENDAGRYKCVVKNDIGTDQHETILTVQVPSTLLPSSSVEYKAVEDKDRVLKIPCKATGLPKPVITWRVNGVVISTNSKYTIEDGALIIRDPKVSDSQSYRCEAKNEAGIADRTFQAAVFQQPDVHGQSSLIIVKGKSVDIKCYVVKGVPIPTMTWYFMANGRSDYKLIRESSNVLRISSVAENDAGRYKCVAKNDIGTDQHETTLTVRVPSTLLPSSSVEYKAVEDKDRVLKIPCKATGLPKPVITWRVNGVAISTSSKYTIEDGALVIRDPKVSDSQSYRCEAKNDAGVAERVFEVVILQKPQITGTAAKTVVKRKSVAIECNVVKGVPIPTMTWYFMANGRSEYKLIRGSTNVLRISSVAENDAGRYKCVAKNDIGIDEHETTLTVRVPSTLLPSSSVEYKAVEDKDRVLKIPCKATGLPKPVITWRVNGVAISTSSKYTIEDGALVIRDPKVSDSQSYRCEAKNDAGVAERVFEVVILQKPQITGTAAKTVVKRKSVAIECNVVKGVPIPTMTWYFMANGRSEYKLIRGSTNVLRISSVAENDAGRYKCVAKNDIGIDEHETTLTVRVPSTLLPSSSVEYKAVEDKDRVLKIPCKATGLPKPVITWRVNGVAISTSSKYTIEDGALIIHDPKVSDSQSYRCEAKNDAGVAERVFEVVILQKPQIAGIAAKTVVKGNSIAFECNVVKGVPKPSITWQYTPNLHSKYMLISGSENVLRIPSVDDNDAGHYKCVARNVVGYDEHITTLGVQTPALLPPSASVVYNAVEEKDAVLKIPCKAAGSPKPTITWKASGVTITPSAKYYIEDGTLVIKDPKVSDTQSYRCEAKNDAGTADRTFQVVIRQAPRVIGSPAKAIVKGNMVVIECNVVKGVPKPSISWQFKGNAHSNYAAIPGTDSVLRITSVDENDAGSYKCVAQNDAGKDEHVTSLTVHTLPKINTSGPVVYKAVEGRDTMLKIPCVATGFPKPIVSWSVKGGVTISTGPKYSIEDGALIIKDPKVTDTQSYRCEAKNDAGPADRTFHAVIFQTPRITGERVKRVAVGKSVTIECNVVKGVPLPTITWQFKANTRSEYVLMSGTDDALDLKHVTKNDAGDYKCVAQSKIGKDDHVTSLIVEYAPTILPTPSKTYDSVEGDVVLRIPCRADGIPRPETTWEVDGAVITPNAHYVITDQALVIKDPKKSDSKSYKCIVKNHLSTVDTTFKAEVHTRLMDYGKIEEIKLLKGSSKTLKCAVSHSSQSSRWYKDGNDLKLKEKFLNLQNVDESFDGKYSCRVSDMRGAHTHTYKVMVGYKPTFTHSHKPIVDWTGKEHDYLDCEVKAKPAAKVVWTLNGKVLSDQKSSRLVLSDNWGRYSCKVSNIYGTEQRSFYVKSTECVVSRKAMNDPTMPLILNSKATWPTLDVTKDYVKIKPGQTVIFSCTDKNTFRTIPSESNITATCDKQDTFTANGESYKITDLQCSHEIKQLVTEKHDRCLNENSELIRIGFEVDCFLESYEVCFDKSKDIPLYARTAMSKSNRGRGTTYKWHNEPGIGHSSDDTTYTCGNTTSSCCYSKNQLVNALDFVDGPTQKSTFIDPLNAIPYWHPCDTDQSPWGDIESMVRSRFDSFDKFVAWTGVHQLEKRDGHNIPRYLWKVLNFDDEDDIAIVYINGPSPSDKDILCENKCDSVPWMRKHSKHVYCCDVGDFLRAFGLQDTTIGELLDEAFERINARCPSSIAPSV